MDFILNAVEVFFLFLAECVYDIARLVYALIITIAESEVFTQDVITTFASRVYVLLGIFMLFKVSFSLINYIVNPDDFTDKQKGVGKLVPNIMITLVLIVFTPRIFAELRDLQHFITSQHVFENVIFGGTYNETVTGDVGDMMALNLFNAFYYYDAGNLPQDAKDITKCENGTCRYLSYYDAFDSDSPYNAYDGIWGNAGIYRELLSLLAAIVLVLVLIQFCFDIAVRTIKFGFLQLIAPVPIISRIDPKSAKDGMFSKWIKMSTKTYLDLFVRLCALYFAVAMIGIVMQTDVKINSNVIGFDAFLVKAFLMLGVLLFAKQLPKLLEDLFGFKLDGGFTLNPMKRLKEVPGANIASAGMAAVGGAALGAGVNLYAGIKDEKAKGVKGFKGWAGAIGRVTGSTLAGGTSSLFRSGYSGLKDNKLKPFKSIGKGVKGSVTARNTRDDREDMGEGGIEGFFGRVGTKINQFAGIQGSDEETLKRERKYKMSREFYKKHGEYMLDENGELVPDGTGGYQKNNADKYEYFRGYDKVMADRWQQVENWKNMSYDYQNAQEAAKQSFEKTGRYTLRFKDGTTREYSSLEEFESDSNKYLNTFNKEKKAFEEMMTKSEHERFRKEYELYTSAADDVENKIKLDSLTKSKGAPTPSGPAPSTSSDTPDLGTPLDGNYNPGDSGDYEDDFKKRFKIDK